MSCENYDDLFRRSESATFVLGESITKPEISESVKKHRLSAIEDIHRMERELLSESYTEEAKQKMRKRLSDLIDREMQDIFLSE